MSYHTASSRPFGATENVPNQCHLFVVASSLMRTGALKLTPPLVLRAIITSVPLLYPGGSTLRGVQTLLFVGPPERSTHRNIWPVSPPGLMDPPTMLPPMFTVVT